MKEARLHLFQRPVFIRLTSQCFMRKEENRAYVFFYTLGPDCFVGVIRWIKRAKEKPGTSTHTFRHKSIDYFHDLKKVDRCHIQTNPELLLDKS